MTAFLLSAADREDGLQAVLGLAQLLYPILALVLAHAIIKGAVLAALKEHERRQRKEQEKAEAERVRRY